MARGMGILPLLIGGAATVGSSFLSSSAASKAASAQVDVAKAMAKAQIREAELRRKTEKEYHIMSLYTDPAKRGQMTMYIGMGALVLIALVWLKKS